MKRRLRLVARHGFLTVILATVVLVVPGAFAEGRTKAPQSTARKVKKVKPPKAQKIKPYKAKKINRKSNRIH